MRNRVNCIIRRPKKEEVKKPEKTNEKLDIGELRQLTKEALSFMHKGNHVGLGILERDIRKACYLIEKNPKRIPKDIKDGLKNALTEIDNLLNLKGL